MPYQTRIVLSITDLECRYIEEALQSHINFVFDRGNVNYEYTDHLISLQMMIQGKRVGATAEERLAKINESKDYAKPPNPKPPPETPPAISEYANDIQSPVSIPEAQDQELSTTESPDVPVPIDAYERDIPDPRLASIKTPTVILDENGSPVLVTPYKPISQPDAPKLIGWDNL